jgi:hypothetical protein
MPAGGRRQILREPFTGIGGTDAAAFVADARAQYAGSSTT